MPRPPSLASLLRPEWRRIVAGALCLAGTNALGFAVPALLKRAIDALHGASPDALEVATRAAGLIVVAAAAGAAIRTASRILIFSAGRNVEYGLRRDLFARLVRRSPSFYQTHPTGDLMSRLTNDLSAVRMLFGPGVLNLINTALVYGVGLWLLWDLNPRLTLVGLLPFPLIIVFGRLSTRTIYRASRALQDQLGALSTTLQEDLAGIAVMRSYTLEDLRWKRFLGLNEEYYQRSLTLVRARGALGPVFAVTAGVGTLVVLWLGGKEVIAGRMSVGELVAFNAYLAFLSWPTLALGWVLSLWQRGVAGWVRVRDLLADVDAPDVGDARPAPDGGAPALADAGVRVHGLTVERDGRRVLDEVSVAIAPGETLAVVGRTGSGKSTLADALLRFVEVPRGAIFLGGRDVRDLALRDLRAAIGYAPQEAFLFSATLAENIAFGRRPPDDDQTDGDGAPGPAAMAEIRAAAEAAGLGRDVAAFPDGYDTLVGERGITLSGGQRQRVALARALYADPRLVVLDDSLSSVDAETEAEILARLAPRLAGRTVIVISHRVSAVRDADQILVLDRGRVVERGRHQALLAAGGVYADLYREQERERAPERSGLA